MCYLFRLGLVASAAALLFSPATAFSRTSTITCHCFQDRSYDPSRPDAADAYFLATAQNTLLAAAFDRPKRDVVMAKQGGTGNEDLWIAYRAAASTGLAPRQLLSEKNRAGHWQPVLRNLNIDLGIAENLAGSGWDEVLARAIFDQVLEEYGFANAQTLRGLREAGSGTQETLLAVLLAREGSRPAMDYYRLARFEKRPWGQMLAENGLADGLGDAVRRQVSSPRN